MIDKELRETLLKNLDLRISYFSSLEKAADTVVEKKSGALIALNAEKLVTLYNKPPLFSRVKNPIFYPDGHPITWFCPTAAPRIPGVELWLKIIEKLNLLGGKVLLVGSSKIVAHKTLQKLQEDFSKITFHSIDGFQPYENYYNQITSFKPDLVFLALGSPKQELLIAEMQKLHNDCIYMGVGGSFDILVGKTKRAPLFFRKFGLEFTYRLLKEPKRIFRQKACLKFLYLFLLGKFEASYEQEATSVCQ